MTILLYLNANIYTMDDQQPRAQAMAIDTQSGRILALGSNDEVRRYSDRFSQHLDLRGKTVIPGFIDAHIHLISTAYRSHHVDARDTSSEDAVIERVRERVSQTPKGHWIQ